MTADCPVEPLQKYHGGKSPRSFTHSQVKASSVRKKSTDGNALAHKKARPSKLSPSGKVWQSVMTNIVEGAVVVRFRIVRCVYRLT